MRVQSLGSVDTAPNPLDVLVNGVWTGPGTVNPQAGEIAGADPGLTQLAQYMGMTEAQTAAWIASQQAPMPYYLAAPDPVSVPVTAPVAVTVVTDPPASDLSGPLTAFPLSSTPLGPLSVAATVATRPPVDPRIVFNATQAANSNLTPGVTSASGSVTPLTPQAGSNVQISDLGDTNSGSMVPLLIGAGVLAFLLFGGKR